MSGEPSNRITEIIDPDEILKQEFAYARDSALQANSDRTQIVNLYLLLVGGIGSLLAGLPALARGEGFVVPLAHRDDPGARAGRSRSRSTWWRWSR